MAIEMLMARDSGGNLQGFQLRLEASGILAFYMLGPGAFQPTYISLTGTTNLRNGVKHHAVATVDGGTNAAVLYLDGSQIASGTASGNKLDIAGGNLNLARRSAPGQYFSGTLDESAFYNTVLSSARVSAHYNGGSGSSAAVLADSPVGYWHLDDTSGTTAVDSSGNSHDGTYHGGYTLSQAGLVSSGTAVSFDGTTGYVDMGSGAHWLTKTMSIEAWFKEGTPPPAGYWGVWSG